MTKNKENFYSQLTEKIDDLTTYCEVAHPQIMANALYNLVRLFRESKSSLDAKIADTTLYELRKSNAAFAPYRQIRKVCIFGSARTHQEHPHYHLAEKFSKKIVEHDFMVITGAGPGIMEAGNKGAKREASFGANIKLPFEQEANTYIKDDPKLVSYRFFFTRKLTFIKESDATVLLPGGFGTHDEGFEVLTLLQTGRSMPRPVILLETAESSYWTHWKSFIVDQLLTEQLVSPEDLNLFKICNSVDDAIAHIIGFYKNYHSIRYTSRHTVIRLNHRLKNETISRLNKAFKYILISGDFEQTDASELLEDHQEYPEKPRLKFNFNNSSFGALPALIEMINSPL